MEEKWFYIMLIVGLLVFAGYFSVKYVTDAETGRQCIAAGNEWIQTSDGDSPNYECRSK